MEKHCFTNEMLANCFFSTPLFIDASGANTMKYAC